MIESKDIEKLASLARIHVSDSEKEGLRKEIESVLSYVEQIQKATGDAPREVPAQRNVMREDTYPHESGIHTETLLNEAPKRKGDYVQVKKIL
jgi:aspartyl-tRNA(Asn)/glutamyl-tRNA(Gln) amidotransferase subunit C